MKTTLSRLFNPEDFFKAYNSNEAFVVHGLNSSIKELTDLPFLNSLESLLNSWPKDIQAHLPDVRDEASSIDTTAKDALKLFDNKMGLLFNHAETISPVLSKWVHELRADLGLSALTNARCLMYATPANAGTAPHFDQNINFVLQLSGTKNWWIAPNTSVENPLTRHTMGLPTDPELESYSNEEMPTEMPEGLKPITLKAGSLLFVPRGSWHSTYAESDALSLNFTFTAPTWLDLFSAAIRGRLAQSPEWRETALFNNQEEATDKFEMLLAELAHDIPHWRARDIIDATEAE